MNPVAGGTQSGDAGGIDGEGAVEPPLQTAAIGRRQVMATGENGDPGTGGNRPFQHQVAQRPAGMGRDDEVLGRQRQRGKVLLQKADPSGKPWPHLLQAAGEGSGTRRQGPVDRQRFRRTVIEEQQDLGEEPVAAGHIDYPPPAKAAPDPPRHLPGFKEFLARQAAGATDRPGNSSEKGLTGKEVKVALVETVAGGDIHVLQGTRKTAKGTD